MGKFIDYIKSKDEMIRAVKVHVLSQGKLIELQRPLQGIASLELKAPVADKKHKSKGKEIKKRQKRLWKKDKKHSRVKKHANYKLRY